MRISTAGKSNRARALIPGSFPAIRGFTFIELTVVIVLIGLMLGLTVPRLRYSLLTDDLKTTVRRMVGTIRSLRTDAVREHTAYTLHFDMDGNRYWVESPEAADEEQAVAYAAALKLPKGVRILDIWRKGPGKEAAGETAIHFTKRGYVEPSAIHLGAEDGRRFTLILRPFLGKVQVVEEYVEFAGLEEPFQETMYPVTGR